MPDRCPHCLAENRGGAATCRRCGRALSSRAQPPAARDVRSGLAHDSLDSLGTVGAGRYRARSSLDSRETIRREDVDLLNDSHAIHLSVGDVLADRWRIEARINSGGMGTVYRVTHVRTHELRALKVMSPALLSMREARQHFVEEAILVQTLRHPGIIEVYDIERSEELDFFTMEYIDGGSLRDRMRSRRGTSPAFSLVETIDLIGQVLAALEYAHRRIVHRDIKPENVLITHDGNVKLADFGLAKLLQGQNLALMSQAMGTPYYMAPEQLESGAPVDARADLFAVGVVFYELLTGQVPMGRFPAVRTLRPDVSARLDEVLERAMQLDPRSRYPSATAMRDALAAAAPGAINVPSSHRMGSKRKVSAKQLRQALRSWIRSPLILVSGICLLLLAWLANLHWSLTGWWRAHGAEQRIDTSRPASPAAEQAEPPTSSIETAIPTPQVAPDPAPTQAARGASELQGRRPRDPIAGVTADPVPQVVRTPSAKLEPPVSKEKAPKVAASLPPAPAAYADSRGDQADSDARETTTLVEAGAESLARATTEQPSVLPAEDGVKHLLQTYTRSLEQKDIARLREIGFLTSDSQAEQLTSILAARTNFRARSEVVELRRLNDDEAVVVFRRWDEFDDPVGKPEKLPPTPLIERKVQRARDGSWMFAP